MNNVLVTGGSGFIGSNLAAALLDSGCSVRVFHRPHSDVRALDGLDVEHALGDIRDRAAIQAAMKGCDTVFHTAALISYWKKERPLMFDVNINGTRNVVDACLELGVTKLIHTSSIAAIGFPEHGSTSDETNEFNWGRFDIGYRISKYEAEKEIHHGVGAGLDAVIVNPAVVMGPRDIHFHAGQLIRDIYRKRIFYYIEGGINIVSVEDVVRGHLAASERGRRGERYILSGENLTHREAITIIAEVVGGIRPVFRVPAPFVRFIAGASELAALLFRTHPWVTRELLAGSHLRYHFSCEKAQRELGYRITPFRQTVERAFEWYRQHSLL